MAITNLTNTKWEVPANWSCTSNYGRFNLNYTLNDVEGYIEFILGYNPFSGDASSNYIFAYGIDSNAEIYPSTSFVINIIDGTDVTNSSLISWLETYGKQIIEETTSPKYEVVYNNLVLATLEKGQKVTLKCSGKKMASDVIVRVKEEINLITFTIDGTSYQAEEGMTWEQWVESSYNTSGYSLHNTDEAVFAPSGLCVNGSVTIASKIIESGGVYTLEEHSHGGGSVD